MRALFAFAVLLMMAPSAIARPRLVVVTATAGFRHESIETAEPIVAMIAAERGIDVVFVRTVDEPMPELTSNDVVMFVSTTGELPNERGVVEWVRNGGTFVGVHSASDTFHEFGEYLEMLGAEFDHHPAETNAEVVVDDASHRATSSLPSSHVMFEEYYVLRRFDPTGVHMLLSLRADPADASRVAYFPLAWEKPFGRGRVLYTALGHREDVWLSEWFRAHIAGVVDWAVTPPARSPRRRAAGK